MIIAPGILKLPGKRADIWSDSCIPLGAVTDVLYARYNASKWAHKWRGAGCVEIDLFTGNDPSIEIANFNGTSWFWLRGNDYVRHYDLLNQVIQTDAEALCLSVFKRSGDCCHNQAITNFHVHRGLSYWKGLISKTEELFPIASILND